MLAIRHPQRYLNAPLRNGEGPDRGRYTRFVRAVGGGANADPTEFQLSTYPLPMKPTKPYNRRKVTKFRHKKYKHWRKLVTHTHGAADFSLRFGEGGEEAREPGGAAV